MLQSYTSAAPSEFLLTDSLVVVGLRRISPNDKSGWTGSAVWSTTLSSQSEGHAHLPDDWLCLGLYNVVVRHFVPPTVDVFSVVKYFALSAPVVWNCTRKHCILICFFYTKSINNITADKQCKARRHHRPLVSIFMIVKLWAHCTVLPRAK